MHDILSCLFLLSVLFAITGAVAAAVSSATFSVPLIPPRPSATVILTSALNPVRNHPREFIQTSAGPQSGSTTTAPFPTYAIGLLALFIVLCALSSVLIITIICSNTARIWIGSVASRVCTSTTAATARLTTRRTVNNDLEHVEEHEKKEEEVVVLNISPANSIPSFHTDVAHKVKSESTTTSSKNTATTPPMPRPAAKFSNRSYENTAASPQLTPPTTSRRKHLSPPTSPSSDHLQTLVLASTGLLMNLTADMQSRYLSRLPPRSTGEVAGDNPVTMVSTPSSPSIKSSGFTATEAAVNPVPSPQISSMKGKNASRSATEIPIPRSPVFTAKHSVAHSSPSHSSSSTFYSLSDDTHLSPSIAFQSLVDLTTLGDSCGIDSESARAWKESPIDDNLGNSLVSPRYVHGMQLATIDEESEEQISPIPLTIPVTQSNTEQPTCPPETGRSSSLSPVPLERRPGTALDVISTASTRYTRGHGLKIILEDLARNPYSAASPATKHLPSTPVGLSYELQSPGLSRFAPAARSAPLPSEPKSGIAHVSALRSPERSPRCHSVAWLSPVIEWAVDDPGEDRDFEVAPESPRRPEFLVNVKGDEECEDALHAADAVAAVMDSLAAIGLDPTAMGLITGDPTFPTSSDAGVRAVAVPPSFVNSTTSPQSRHAQAAADNLVEEQEVEKEVGNETRGLANSIPSSSSLRSQCPENSHLIRGQLSTQSYIPSLRDKPISEEQLHGERVETAKSFCHSSSLHTDSGGTEAKDIETNLSEASGGTAGQKTLAVQLVQQENARIHHKQVQIISAVVEDLGGSKINRAMGRVRSPSIGQPLHTPRGQPDRLYPSPSSLAGLSHVEVAKRFSSQSPSSAVSTPSPRGKYPSPPPGRSPPVSPLRLREAKGTSLSPVFGNTPSTLTSSPRNDPASPSPRSRSPMFLPQQPEPMTTLAPSSLGSSHSTPMNFLRRKPRDNSSVSHSHRHKPSANTRLGGSTPILRERTNSMEFRAGQV